MYHLFSDMELTVGKLIPTSSGVEWIIEDIFSLSDKYYVSPSFRCAGGSWHLGIDANSFNRKKLKHIGVSLLGSSSGPPIHLEFTLSVKCRNGTKYGETSRTNVFRNEYEVHEIPVLTISELMQRKSELVPGGVLTFICEFKPLELTEFVGDAESAKCSYCEGSFGAESISSHQKKCLDKPVKCPECSEVVLLQNWYEHKCQNGSEGEKVTETSTVNNTEGNESGIAISNEPESSVFHQIGANEAKKSGGSLVEISQEHDLTNGINYLLEARRGIDVTFVLETPNGPKEVFAHRLILVMWSSDFASKFYGEQRNKEAVQVIFLKNVKLKPFKDMISYCYGRQPCLKTAEETCALIEVASQFKVTSLVNVCRTFLKNVKIEPGNVFCLLRVSENTEDKSLRDKCNKLLQERTKEVLEFYELRDVTPFMVHVILHLPKLSLSSEYELIKWIFDWARVKSQEDDSICQSNREYLEKLLQDMNFLALTFQEFAMLCKDNRNFFSSNEFESVAMNIAIPGAIEMPDWYDKDLRIRQYIG